MLWPLKCITSTGNREVTTTKFLFINEIAKFSAAKCSCYMVVSPECGLHTVPVLPVLWTCPLMKVLCHFVLRTPALSEGLKANRWCCYSSYPPTKLRGCHGHAWSHARHVIVTCCSYHTLLVSITFKLILLINCIHTRTTKVLEQLPTQNSCMSCSNCYQYHLCCV